MIFWPALSLMVLALVSWLLLDPLRDMSEDSDSWIAALPEGIAVGIFVGAVEGMFLQLIPMRYMDGYKIWSWNKLAWLALAGLAAFLFWHALLNSERSSWDALDEATPATAIGLMAICFGLTLAVWAYFRFKPQPVESEIARERGGATQAGEAYRALMRWASRLVALRPSGRAMPHG